MFKIRNFRRLVDEHEIFIHMEYEPFELIGLKGYLSVIDDYEFHDKHDKKT